MENVQVDISITKPQITEKLNFITFHSAVIGTHLMLSPHSIHTVLVVSHYPPTPPSTPCPTHPSRFWNKVGGGLIIIIQLQIIRKGQVVHSNTVCSSLCSNPPPSSPTVLLAPSPFARTALSVGNISQHHCRLSVHDSDCGSHLHRGERCAANLSGEPDKTVLMSAAGALEHQLIAV